MITPDITTLEESRCKAKDKRNNILNVLKNLESVFTGFYFHHCNVPKPESEESIAERKELRRQRSAEIVKKEKMIDPKLFREYFEYLSPSVMSKNLNKATGSEENKAQINTISNRLANMKEAFKSNPTRDAKKVTTEITC